MSDATFELLAEAIELKAEIRRLRNRNRKLQIRADMWQERARTREIVSLICGRCGVTVAGRPTVRSAA